MTVALAAALVEMAARYADDDATGAAAANLRARAEPLADRDAEAYAAYLSARRDRRTGKGDDATVEAAAVAATAVPVELAELGAAVATLGAELVAGGNPRPARSSTARSVSCSPTSPPAPRRPAAGRPRP